MNRRHFFQSVMTLSGLAILAPRIWKGTWIESAQAQERRRGSAAPAAGGGKDLDLPLVEPGKGMAVSVHYAEKHADVKDAKLKIERMGTAFDKQYCNNCSFYTTVGKKGADEVGKCTIFANQLVKSQAWCQTWNKKS